MMLRFSEVGEVKENDHRCCQPVIPSRTSEMIIRMNCGREMIQHRKEPSRALSTSFAVKTKNKTTVAGVGRSDFCLVALGICHSDITW